MDIVVNDTKGMQPRVLIRRAGYAEHIDRRSGETSYIRRLSPEGFYPRFHAYLHPRDDESLMIRLHIDQKQPSYGVGTHAHSGEYDGPLLDRERDRIISTMQSKLDAVVTEKRGFWSKFFGSK